MSTIGLFIAGAVVTMIVATALGLLVWAAIVDGREQRERETEDKLASNAVELGRRRAA